MWINYYTVFLIAALLSFYTAPPIIDTPSSNNLTVDVGTTNVTLSCISRGSPPDTFTWQKDGDLTVLQSTSITTVEHTETAAVFRADYVIDVIMLSNNGTYTCNVVNPIGSDTESIIITTIGTWVFYFCYKKFLVA